MNRNNENRLKNWPWAYTGSVAMKIHANRLGVPFPKNRRIGNVNIAVRPNAIFAIIPVLSKSWNLKTSPNYKHVKMHSKRNANKNLNMFPANGRLAPNYRHVQKFNKYPPVMSVRALLNQKLGMNENNYLGNYETKKYHTNVAFLKKLLNTNNRRRRQKN